MEIVAQALELMGREGNPQWCEDYPTQMHFARDIEAGTLYVWQEDGAVGGFACLDREQPAEYDGLPWSRQGDAIVLHRMAVSKACRGRGVSGQLLDFASALAGKEGAGQIRTDTNSRNSRMAALLAAHGYRQVGEIHFPDIEDAFVCFEKLIG